MVNIELENGGRLNCDWYKGSLKKEPITKYGCLLTPKNRATRDLQDEFGYFRSVGISDAKETVLFNTPNGDGVMRVEFKPGTTCIINEPIYILGDLSCR